VRWEAVVGEVVFGLRCSKGFEDKGENTEDDAGG